MTTFNIKMDTDDKEGKAVLVFLKPHPQPFNAFDHAWQKLPALAGFAESFDYKEVFSATVTSEVVNPGSVITSGLVQGGSPSDLTPTPSAAEASLPAPKLTPQQAGPVDYTECFVTFDGNGYATGEPVVTMRNFDET